MRALQNQNTISRKYHIADKSLEDDPTVLGDSAAKVKLHFRYSVETSAENGW